MPSLLSMMRTMLTVLCLAACAGDIAPPDTPPTYNGAPPPVTGGPYVTYETSRVFDAPLVPLRRWIEGDNRIVAAMEETDRIKKPVDVVVLSGVWPEVGSVRRLEFSDGHYTLERVLKNNFPTLFRYQVWQFTSSAGGNLDYALGQQAWIVLADGRSQLTWTYSLRPNASYKRPFVRRFLENDMQPLMNGALDAVQTQAEAAFDGRP